MVHDEKGGAQQTLSGYRVPPERARAGGMTLTFCPVLLKAYLSQAGKDLSSGEHTICV